MFTSTNSEQNYLIVGLGNPGREYQHTRHNIGFMVVNRLATKLGEKFTRLEMRALVTKAYHQSARLILAKPQTFMNNSGNAVSALARYYKVPLSNLLVAYDDVDLPLGVLRLRPMGGSAGQKGMQSIIERLGTDQFPRMRVGIGRPPGRMDAASYVLQDFHHPEVAWLPEILDRAVDAVLLYINEGLEKAMNRYNVQPSNSE
jgi:PTH1 family peptidyl-tRNA hydrolase